MKKPLIYVKVFYDQRNENKDHLLHNWTMEVLGNQQL